MGTHAFALGGAWAAYRLAQRAGSRYAFGGWKIEVLAAYSSGLLLLAVSLWIGIDAVRALAVPHAIDYRRAITVAAIGLVVNAVCAGVLARGAGGRQMEHDHHGHGHAHDHAHRHDHAHGHDHNFRAAYLHVLADALTSVLAIAALGAGLAWGWRWLDPAVALLGGVLIARWAWHVLRDSARALVDASADAPLRHAVHAAIENDGDARIADLHVWQVGSQAWSAVISVVADHPLEPAAYAERLHALPTLRHVTVEVHRCRGDAVSGASPR
jgi:cation diffusion facilitator family transporter